MSLNYLTVLLWWLHITIIFVFNYQKEVCSNSLPVTSTATVVVTCSVFRKIDDDDYGDDYYQGEETDKTDSDLKALANVLPSTLSTGLSISDLSICTTGQILVVTESDLPTNTMIIPDTNPTTFHSTSQSSIGKNTHGLDTKTSTLTRNVIYSMSTMSSASSTMGQLATVTTGRSRDSEVSITQSLTGNTLITPSYLITPGPTPVHTTMIRGHTSARSNSLLLSTTVITSVALVSTTPKPNTPLQSKINLREGYSKQEISLLVVVIFASFLLILASFFILTITLIVVVRRKRAEKVVNVITVHNYGSGANDEPDTESLCATQLIEETSINNNIMVSDEVPEESLQSAVQVSDKAICDQVTPKNDSITLKSTMPVLMDYEQLVTAKEGEQVTFCVNFTGFPKPTITWIFEGTEVEGDYATEVGMDGSLVFFRVEHKHAGKYDFEIENSLGVVQGSVQLVVEAEYVATQQEATDVVTAEKINNLESNPIAEEKFREYVAGLHLLNNKAFEIQYKSLLSGEEGKQVSVGRSDKLRGLNRFRNITAYDDCRIVLEPITGCRDYQYDYINASYVDGLSQDKRFIATQGPLSHTVIDFWRLVWQEKVKAIAMVTNLREGMKVKCEQYWPEQGQEMQIGPYMVTNVQQQSFPYFNIRKMVLKYTAAEIVGIAVSREITQYHFTSWPDHAVPECPGPILSYLQKIKSGHKTDDGPILVHCSAGVGRTGTLIAIDIALSQASKEKQVDIPKIIVNMRRQRMKMVQTVNQYVFVHDAVLEALICGDTQILVSDLLQAIERLKQKHEHNEGKTGFEQQFEILEQMSPKPLLEIARSSALRHPDKNRSNDFLPSDKWRVRLKGRNPDQDYIHASYAHGYKQKKAFIIAQSPMMNTVGDFVKMLYERECGVVVMLCGCEEGGVEMCAQYWPTTIDATMKHEELLVSAMKVTEGDGITQRLITVTDSKSDKAEPHKVTQFQVDQWNAEGLCSNTQALIEVLNQIREIQKNKIGNNPVAVHGSDTVSRVGVFCSLVNAIEMCKTEGVVDVFQVIKALRRQKPGAVPTLNQYSFIFDVALSFLDTHSS